MTQPITGVMPPQSGEAMIREVWPSVAAYPTVARLGRSLIRSWLGAPIGWLLMAPFYFLKILPFLATRYTLTNRRLMIRRGLKPEPIQDVGLAEIDDVRINSDDNSDFFRASNLAIISQGKTVLTLAGVPEPESLRHSIIEACQAWGPGKLRGPFVPAKAPAPS
jgi:hypothetical protein